MTTTTTRIIPKLVHKGVAAEDIEKDSVILKIICPEILLGSTTGGLGAGITTGTVTLKGRDGNTIKSNFTSANHLVATWEGASNMKYPPLIREGEPVEVYQEANQDKYFWRATGQGKDFRKTDRVHIEVSATDPSKPGTTTNDQTSYSAYLDSDAKKVGFKTSMANGEAAAFIVEADLDAGTFVISDKNDGTGNRIFLDNGAKSGVPTFQVNLVSGAVIKFEEDNGFIKVPKKMMFSAGERLVFDSPIIVFNVSKIGTIIMNAASIALNGTRDLVITSGVLGLNAASTKLSGVLKAASAKITNLVKGPVTGQYNPSDVSRPADSPVQEANNSADTDMSGTPYT